MADNITIVISGGGTAVMKAKDNTSVYTPYHAICREDGTVPLKIVAEDAAHSSGDSGIVMMAVRQDTAAALGGTDADYMPPIVNSVGHLWTTVGAHATGIGKAEDAAHSTGEVGAFMLGVRSDAAASTGGTDGDYVGLTLNSTGMLWTAVGAHATSIGKAEDAAHSTGETGAFVMGVRSDTAASTGGTDGDYVGLTLNSTGMLWTTVGAHATSIGKAEDAAHSTGETGAFTLGVRNDADATIAGTDLDYSGFAVDIAGRAKVNVVEERVILDVTPVCDTSAYTAGDVLFDRITCGTVARVNGGTVVLESVVVLDEDDQAAAEMDLYFLDSDVTLGTANAAVSISDANARKIVGHVNIPSANFKDLINSKCAFVKGINMSMKCAAASQILYVAGTTAGTPTQTADGIKLKLAFRRGI